MEIVITNYILVWAVKLYGLLSENIVCKFNLTMTIKINKARLDEMIVDNAKKNY